jgi:hypothetical protein
MAPMRKDVGVVLSRVEPAWHGGDAKLAKSGKPLVVAAAAEGR